MYQGEDLAKGLTKSLGLVILGRSINYCNIFFEEKKYGMKNLRSLISFHVNKFLNKYEDIYIYQKVKYQKSLKQRLQFST